MDKHFEVSVGQVDFDRLTTDEDFRQAAEHVLPVAIQKSGEVLAEEAWDLFKTRLRTVGARVTASKKREFVRDFLKNHEQIASTTGREAWLDKVILHLREQKIEHAAKPR